MLSRVVRKERIDKLLMEKGIVQSRERARSFIMAGKVMVEGRTVDKPGTKVKVEAQLQVRGKDQPYVSRGGLKLEGGSTHLEWIPKGWW